MSKTARIFLIVLCLSATLSAQVLGTMEITHVPDAERGPWINQDPDHAILVVYSDIEKMTFQTNHGGIVDLDNPNRGVYRIWLMPGTHQITYSAEGFRSEKDRIYIQAKDVGEVRVKVVDREPSELLVVIRVEPAGAKVLIDDSSVDISGTLKLPIGEHNIMIVKSGYVTIEEKFNISNENILFEYTLEFGIEAEIPLQEMGFVEVPGGTFMMGSPVNEKDRNNNEKQHSVTISSFQMMTTEITQSMWKAVMGNNPSNWKGDKLPVENVSWDDCQAFIRELNERDPGSNYRLPTEAEWEYACRAETTTRLYNGDRDSDLDRIGWYAGNSGSKTHPVGQKQPNAWGLYDMHGNVWEWCQDWKGNYPSGSVADPRGPSSGSARVCRGGSWSYGSKYCRSAIRNGYAPSYRYFSQGFRLVRSL